MRPKGGFVQMTRETVIVAVDGSDAAVDAARSGLALLHPDVDVVIVTVVEPSEEAMPVSGFAGSVMSPEEIEADDEARTAAARTDLDAAATALGLHDHSTLVLRGSPGAALCDIATERSARAIVMGSRGRGGLKRALLGSVSDHVVRNSPCPVVITRPV
jgi:nucleotide-binding universal stress UspA family protein